MRMPEPDVTHIVLSVYVLTITSPIGHKIDLIQVNLIQLKIFEFELDFAEYIQPSTLMCGLRIFAGPPIRHLPGNVISATVSLVCINVQPKYKLSSSTHL